MQASITVHYFSNLSLNYSFTINHQDWCLLYQVTAFNTSQPMIYSTPSSVESEEYKKK